MVHVPAASRVTVDPETLQTVGVVEANVTGREEVAVAEIAKGAVPNGRFERGVNVID